ncbi:MAG: hypothetical protein JNL83_37350 [Myxococcales bacterium]|nr:hypothetical protein [Myxococcales bacterium]
MVRTGLVVVCLVSFTAVAHAGDQVVKVGEGYELVLPENGSIGLRKGKRKTTLIPASSFDIAAKVDAKARKVTITRSEECAADKSDTFTFDQLEARLLNVEALALHRKKDWANAAKGFAQAAKLDPAYRLAAFNLASAHSRLGQLAEANAALAPWFKAEPLATYVQVNLDPELSPLLATKEVTAVKGTTKPGTITIDSTGKLAGGYAFSPERNWIAVPHSDAGYLDCSDPASIQVFDLATTKIIATLPLGSVPQTSEPCEPRPKKAAVEKAKADRAAKAKTAEAILVAFGFSKTAAETAGATEKGDDSEKRVARFDKAKIGVVENGGNVNVLRGNTSLGKGGMSGGRFTRAAYLPDAKAVVITSYVPSDMCARTDEDVIAVKP